MSHLPGLYAFGVRFPTPPTWERDQADALARSLADRREREESDRRTAQEAAEAGFICCSCCGGWTRYAEDRCDQCGEPVDAGSDPLYELSKTALEALSRERAVARGEAPAVAEYGGRAA